jgi:hypothetical protein
MNFCPVRIVSKWAAAHWTRIQFPKIETALLFVTTSHVSGAKSYEPIVRLIETFQKTLRFGRLVACGSLGRASRLQ